MLIRSLTDISFDHQIRIQPQIITFIVISNSVQSYTDRSSFNHRLMSISSYFRICLSFCTHFLGIFAEISDQNTADGRKGRNIFQAFEDPQQASKNYKTRGDQKQRTFDFPFKCRLEHIALSKFPMFKLVAIALVCVGSVFGIVAGPGGCVVDPRGFSGKGGFSGKRGHSGRGHRGGHRGGRVFPAIPCQPGVGGDCLPVVACDLPVIQPQC